MSIRHGVRYLIIFIGMSLFAPLSLAHTPSMLADIHVNLVSADGKQVRPCPNPRFTSYCTLTIYLPYISPGSIQISNDSHTTTAKNITADISSISSYVTFQGPVFITLKPGERGTLSFIPLVEISPTLVEVKGANTKSGFFYIEVGHHG